MRLKSFLLITIAGFGLYGLTMALPPLGVNTCLESNENRCQLEDYSPLSKSHIWKLVLAFYDQQGEKSWSEGTVPHFVSSNAYIGRSYAQILHGYIKDALEASQPLLDVNEPLYIVELGAGHGKLSFYMLKALVELQDACAFPINKIVYVMTDFTENNFNFWKNHPNLKQYVDAGQIDFAIFDAGNGHSMTLANSGVVLNPGSSVNPVVVVANYLFDTLYQDIFRVEHSQLKEGLISLGSNRTHEPDALDPAIVTRMENRFQYNAVPDDYYSAGDEEGDEPHLERILHWYRDYFKGPERSASLLLPIGALRALRRLSALSGGRMMLISGDKGHNKPDHFSGLYEPHFALHGATFSLMLNYHALGMYFTSRGGFAIHNPQEDATFKVSACVMTGNVGQEGDAPDDDDDTAGSGDWTGSSVAQRDEARAAEFPHLRMAFQAASGSFSATDFFTLYQTMTSDISEPKLSNVVAFLKLSNGDPDVFYRFRDPIRVGARSAKLKLRHDLIALMDRVWDNYYVLNPRRDLGFEFGRIYYAMDEHQKALKSYEHSTIHIGPHHVTYSNQGLCYSYLGHHETALEYFEKSLELKPDYPKAVSWQQKEKDALLAARKPAPPPNDPDMDTLLKGGEL